MLALTIPFIKSPIFAQEAGSKIASVPQECAKEVADDTGEPTTFPFDGPLQWGISTRPARSGSPLVVLLWIANSTEKLERVATCSDIDRFWLFAIDVVHESGHVVPWRGGKVRNTEDDGLFCFRNFAITIAPHTCRHTTFTEHEFDFSRDLQTIYDLPPGKYFIVPRVKAASANQPTSRISETSPKLAIDFLKPRHCLLQPKPPKPPVPEPAQALGLLQDEVHRDRHNDDDYQVAEYLLE
jgi:hypothetical protein